MSRQIRWADAKYEDLSESLREKLEEKVSDDVLEDAVMTSFIALAHRHGTSVGKEIATCYLSYVMASGEIKEILGLENNDTFAA